MFYDYTELVLRYYEEKKVANMLPAALANPTPAKIKKACLQVCKERFQSKDGKTLKDFFDAETEKAAILKAIDRFDVDKFRPLNNRLKSQTDNTDEKNIELLAWLIDFEPRPFQYGPNYGLNKTVMPESNFSENKTIDVQQADNSIDEPEGVDSPAVTPITETPVIASPDRKEEKKKKLQIVNLRFDRIKLGLVVLLFVVTAVFIYREMAHRNEIAMGGSCMYWNIDHYERILCNVKKEGVIPYEAETLETLRKITRTDTITIDHVGRVWCIRTNDVYEYFTAPGKYPADRNRNLKPLSVHIFNNHLAAKQ